MIFPVAVRHWVDSSNGNPAYEPWSYLVKLLLVERAAKDWSSLQNSCKTNSDQWSSLFRCLNNWSLSTQLIQPCAVITSTVGRRLISCPILFLRLLKLNPPNIDLKKTGLRQLKTLFQKLFVPLVTIKIKEGWVDHCWIYQQKGFRGVFGENYFLFPPLPLSVILRNDRDKPVNHGDEWGRRILRWIWWR